MLENLGAAGRCQTSVAVCPVRKRCLRFQASGYTKRRAEHDQGPHGYPVSEVKPMVRSDSLLTTIVTLSLGRPHFSCKEARPEGLAGTYRPEQHASSMLVVSLALKWEV